MKLRTIAAVVAWAAVLAYAGYLRVAKWDAEQEANAVIGRLNNEVWQLETELAVARSPAADVCLDMRLRIDRVPYDEHGVMIDLVRVVPRRPDCFGGRTPRITNLVVRDGRLVLRYPGMPVIPGEPR